VLTAVLASQFAAALLGACADRETLFGDQPASSPSESHDAHPDAGGYDADAQLQRAHAALDAKDYDSAESTAKAVIAHDANGYPEAYVVLGDVKLARKDPAGALALFDKAIALDADDDWSQARAAEALDQLDKHGQARDRLRAYVASHAKAGEDVQDALGWEELELHDAARAESAFRRALEVTGDKDGDAYYGLAAVAASRHDAAAAERALTACFARDPAKRLEAADDESLAPVRSSPAVRALFTKDKLDEARRADAGAR
jgi:predicted Zn-dependent protease